MLECVEFIKHNLYSKKEEVEDNFKLISNQRPCKIIAVDGGSSIINDGGSWLIAKIKTASTYYDGDKRIPKKELVNNYYMSLINNSGRHIQRFSPEISLSTNYSGIRELSEAPSVAMKAIELFHAAGRINDLGRDSLLLVDGLLKAESIDQEKALKELEEKSCSKGVHVIGLAKTCRFGLKGRSVIGSLLRAKPDDKWFYHPVSGEEVFIIKLHEKSKYAYMLDLFPHSMNSIDLLMPSLCFYARDPELLGYPYPLLRADKIARVGEHEKKQEESRLRILSKMEGYSFLETDKRATDMHARMDKRAYR